MTDKKKAAIDLDEIGEKSLSEISAADFLAALDTGGAGLKFLTYWPEKKKVELWTEPEGGTIVKVIIEKIRIEKKKVELEKPPGVEHWPDWRDLVYDDLLDRLTADIEARLKK